MKSILELSTGKLLYCAIEFELKDNEIAIDELLVINMENPYFNFETREFYNKEI
tara:strand:+ start:283 stop:444 length:162 start_codon:yes stop_codon:yes gene_type:complete